MSIDQVDAQVRELARSLDCLTEEELRALAGITEGTALAWRKRGQGPAYVMFGNRVLYPRSEVSKHLQTLVRERRGASARELL